MPRKPREEVADGVFHVYARGNNQERIYRDAADFRRYLALLGETVVDQGWHCFAYCLMDNHLHMLLETPKPNLGAGMQRAHGRYGRAFNDRHGRSGHVFQGPYGAERITGDLQFLTVVRYVVRNAVEAGLCDSPGAWPWCSHSTLADPPAWLAHERLLSHFAEWGGDAAERYAAWVEDDF